MGIVRVEGQEARCQVLCLDKDGLMFERDVFWRALWRAREQVISGLVSSEGLQELRSLTGVSPEDNVDPNGPFALASPSEEAIIIAAVLRKHCALTWDTALETAKQCLKVSDEQLDLKTALIPRPGFPDILKRAKAAGMKVAVVTADDEHRAIDSLEMFGIVELIDLVCTPTVVRNSKPYPDMLKYVERELGVDTTEFVMVGDSLVDVEMAAAAGAIGIGVPYPDSVQRFEGRTIVSTLDDIVLIAD